MQNVAKVVARNNGHYRQVYYLPMPKHARENISRAI
jgi:hypothetical protein